MELELPFAVQKDVPLIVSLPPGEVVLRWHENKIVAGPGAMADITVASG